MSKWITEGWILHDPTYTRHLKIVNGIGVGSGTGLPGEYEELFNGHKVEKEQVNDLYNLKRQKERDEYVRWWTY